MHYFVCFEYVVAGLVFFRFCKDGVGVVQVQDAYVFVSIAGGHRKSTGLVGINSANGLDGRKDEVCGIVDGMDGGFGGVVPRLSGPYILSSLIKASLADSKQFW